MARTTVPTDSEALRGPVSPTVERGGVWRNRIVGSGEEAPDQLLANPANWRTHPGPQRDALRGSLSTVGWVAQVLVNRRTGFVIDGHARIEEAISRGEPTVPVLYVELDPDEEALHRALTNHSGDVYDPFVGSGTTIIAAEQLNRRCYAMEIDPRYVAVSMKRWEDFTGRTAERLP